jgi:hypothetical protein
MAELKSAMIAISPFRAKSRPGERLMELLRSRDDLDEASGIHSLSKACTPLAYIRVPSIST